MQNSSFSTPATPSGSGRGRLFPLSVSSLQPQPQIHVVFPPKKRLCKFSGRCDAGGVEVEDFIEEAQRLMVGESDPAYFILSHLEGTALEEVKRSGAPRGTPEEIFCILRSAFGDQRALPSVYRWFADRLQQPHEAVRAYANDLVSRHECLRRRQRQLQRPISTEEELVDQFVEGLHDPALVLDLKRQRRAGVASFQEVRELAIEWETVRGTKGSRKASSSATHLEPDPGCWQEVAQRLERLELRLMERDPARGGTSQGVHPTHQFRNNSRPPVLCHYCRKPGHIARDCLQRRQDLNDPRSVLGATPLTIKRT
jgi:hypothetical protein